MAGASRRRWERGRSGWRAYWWASTGRIVVVAERGDDEGRVQSRQPTIPVARTDLVQLSVNEFLLIAIYEYSFG